MVQVTVFTAYNLVMGLLAAAGLVYLLYTQRVFIKYRRFLYFLVIGFLVFSIGGPLTDLFAPGWAHLVHGFAALFVIFGLYNPVHNDLRTGEWMELLLEEPNQVRHPREWMQPVDTRILELFHSSELVLTPTIIAYNIDYSAKEVNRRLLELEKYEFVRKVERGKYQMTELGERYLQGQLGTETVNRETE